MSVLRMPSRLKVLLGQLSGAEEGPHDKHGIALVPQATPCAGSLPVELQPVLPESVGLSSERLKRLDKFVESIVKDGQAPMAAVGVIRHNQLAYLSMAGHSHEEQNVPVAQDTIYRMYSFTKPVVSVALLMLYEEGRFSSFDEPIAKYIPCFKDMQVYVSGDGPENLQTRRAKTAITIKHLLTHTSGFGYGHAPDIPAVSKILWGSVSFGPPQPHRDDQPVDVQEACERLAKCPLLCDPGTEWHYGYSTDVVGRLVEVLSGQALGDLLQARIFGPLGMLDTSFFLPPSKVHRFAGRYGTVNMLKAGGWLQKDPDKKSYVLIEDPRKSDYAQPPGRLVSAGGGLLSTIPDWLRWMKFLLRKGATESGERLLSQKTFDYAALNHLPECRRLDVLGAKSTQHVNVTKRDGMGWALFNFTVIEEPALQSAVCSKGELAWGSAGGGYLWIDHEEDLAVILQTQLEPSSAFPWRRHLRGLVYQALMN